MDPTFRTVVVAEIGALEETSAVADFTIPLVPVDHVTVPEIFVVEVRLLTLDTFNNIMPATTPDWSYTAP